MQARWQIAIAKSRSEEEMGEAFGDFQRQGERSLLVVLFHRLGHQYTWFSIRAAKQNKNIIARCCHKTMG